jgi:hypothetical protein
MLGSSKPLTPERINAARLIAVIADILQIILFPMFSQGFFSPLDDVLDFIVAILMYWLVGFHIVFVPSLIIKLLPIADEAPTWTIAVLIATHGRKTLNKAE